ncbi:hypothetical protein OQZ33_16480 [Pedobacter sp. MC2016-05]|jgi:hypothetical protein|uniref:hypothetical protein n=1 Tax=unclassified Pedobacter TaxID=2628915 RepID=UPI0007031881|nr:MULTISPECIES: hypothetical protein [unclassified Pedobacter]KQN35220.1 hypothetical protein ASE92_11415 [Pedobacter sp. Leaf41]MCX2475930.1 hypothetical protein [Pedobacter sp. MC2016-05]
MNGLSIQQLFDQYQDIILEVELAKKNIDETPLKDLSEEDYISADEAEKYVTNYAERERKMAHLERVSQEWSEISDELAAKLCIINTKVLVNDKRDDTKALIYCVDGAVTVEEIE